MLKIGKENLSNEELCKFFRVIQKYNNAGVTLTESVANYAENVEEKRVREIAKKILRDMRNGTEFSEALSKHKEDFPAFIVEIIRVGEESGQIAKVLEEIVFYLEQEIEVDREVRQALWTPKAFMIGMAIAFAVALLIVIPKMGELLTEAHIDLPLVTQMVINIGKAAQSFWWLFLIVAVGLRIFYREMEKKYPERAALLALKVPFFKVITYNQMQYRFAKILGLCAVANIRTSTALKYTALASDNLAMKETLLRAVREMEATSSQVWDALKKADINKILNKDFFVMLRVGAATGQLGGILMAEAMNYQKDMLAASKLIGDKVGIAVTIPGYLALILLFAAIEYPVIEMMENMNFSAGGM